MDTLLLDALQCKNLSRRPPVWLMRQAGRYMPEYRAIRAKYSFLEMCHHPELIAEVTHLPVNVFGMDAAILFSDILLIPEAFGVGLHFEEGIGPIIERPLNSPDDIDALPQIEMRHALRGVVKGIKLLRTSLDVPLIGFCGGPFTLASYMIEGKASRDLKKTKKWMLQDPSSFHRLLKRLALAVEECLEIQIDAGVQVVQIFDSWAGVLGHSQFCEFSRDYLKQIVEKFKSRLPIILFCRGSSVFAKELADAGPHAISIDWNADLSSLRQMLPSSIALQGNLDPDILTAPLAVVRHETHRLLEKMRGSPGYIFNLGHGIHPDVPIDAVKVLVECVKTHLTQKE